MNKRILSLALALCLLAGLLPCLTMGAAAASQVDAAPYASVEYTKNSGVSTGTVRYISQVPAFTDQFCPEYWGSYVNYANHECFTACISMALSYLGIDATPGALGDYWRSCGHYGTPFATTPDDVAFSGATYSKTSLAEAISCYVGGAGSYSPPIIHLNSYSANGHYVMIIGQVSASEYRVLDPAKQTIYTMTLTNGSTVNYFRGSERVTEAVQYYYPVHHWSPWTAIKTDDGATDMQRTCYDCGKTETAKIPDVCVGDEYCAGGVFTDMPAVGSWMHGGLDYCVLFGLMGGIGGDRIAPNNQTTRAMLVQILYSLAGKPDVSKLPELRFTDVADGDWYADAVRWAYAKGATGGVDDEHFAPNSQLTRAQLVTMLYRIYGPDRGVRPRRIGGYQDWDSVPDWAMSATTWAISMGVIGGVSSSEISPNTGAIRGQLATIMMRVCQLQGELDS